MSHVRTRNDQNPALKSIHRGNHGTGDLFAFLETQPHETSEFTAVDHLEALLAHGGPGLVDLCVVNTGGIPADLLARYRQEGARPVDVAGDRIRALGVRPLETNVVSTEDYVRHDPQQLARILIDLVLERKEHGRTVMA